STPSFSAREIPNFGRAMDYPPLRFSEEPVPSGPNEGHSIPRKQLGEEVKDISDRVKEVFYDYPWPGNVRELEHVIEGAMNIVNGEQTIRINHLPCHVLNMLKASKHITGDESSFSKYGSDFTKECQV
ncbi:arginine utilization regulatory protein RocR, partial [Candidatus Magnetoovum chiemensis]